MYHLRVATEADVSSLNVLIEQSVRGLSAGHYSAEQIDSALRHLFGADTQLIADGTYFVVDVDGTLVAGGGWSRRRTRYGGDQMKTDEDPLIDPATEPARIRAFFVHPAWSRRGLGRLLFEHCLAAARDAGFRDLELVATLPGEPLYAALGFETRDRFMVSLPDGIELSVTRMWRAIDPLQPEGPRRLSFSLRPPSPGRHD